MIPNLTITQFENLLDTGVKLLGVSIGVLHPAVTLVQRTQGVVAVAEAGEVVIAPGLTIGPNTQASPGTPPPDGVFVSTPFFVTWLYYDEPVPGQPAIHFLGWKADAAGTGVEQLGGPVKVTGKLMPESKLKLSVRSGSPGFYELEVIRD